MARKGSEVRSEGELRRGCLPGCWPAQGGRRALCGLPGEGLCPAGWDTWGLLAAAAAAEARGGTVPTAAAIARALLARQARFCKLRQLPARLFGSPPPPPKARLHKQGIEQARARARSAARGLQPAL